MPIKLLATPTSLRTALNRLLRTAEHVDLRVPAVDDPDLVKRLCAAAARDASVRVTLALDAETPPDVVQTLLEAGVDVGGFEPATHGRRTVGRFGPGLFLFDHETDFWTAAITGSFSGTTSSLTKDLEIATLLESDDFTDGDVVGGHLSELIRWADGLNHKPVDARRLARHRKAWEAARAPKPKPTPAPAPPAPAKKPAPAVQVVEVKPDAVGYASALSWQQLRRCDWGTYWHALLEADKLRGEGKKDGLCGPRGWLVGIDGAHRAYMAGPEAWSADDVRADLLGRKGPAKLLGKATARPFTAQLDDAAFTDAFRAAAERCIADPSADTMRDALAPLVAREDVSVPEVSRLLAAAAPDRFPSILGETMQLRVGNIVGFDLSEDAGGLQDQLSRYADAVEIIRGFPWASATSAERTSDHPWEADAWAKRVALLGCLIC